MKKSKIFNYIFGISMVSSTLPLVCACNNSSTNEVLQNQKQTTVQLSNSQYHKVTFEKGEADSLSGTTVFEIKDQRKFGSIIAPVAIKKNYKFNYWQSEDGTKYTENTKIEKDVNLTPIFELITVQITFDTIGSETKIEPITPPLNSTWKEITEKPADPIKTGCKFKQWLLSDGTPIYDEYKFEKDTNLIAQYIEDIPVGYVKVTFSADYKTTSGTTEYLLKEGSTLESFPIPKYFKISSTYINFQDETGTTYTTSTPINKSITLTPLWIDEVVKSNYMGCFAYEDSTIALNAWTATNAKYVYYSIDNCSTWNRLMTDAPVTVKKGNSIYLYSENSSGFNQYDSTNNVWIDLYNFYIQGAVALSGSPMALINGTSTGSTLSTTIPNIQCFHGLFKGSTGIKTITGNFLTATTVTQACYAEMFQNCCGLENLPENLISSGTSITMSTGTCDQMFRDCTGLKKLPENLLKYCTLGEGCFASMFAGCSGLTTIPVNFLPAETLTKSCYQYMFWGCSGLTTLPEDLLPSTTLAQYCYAYMFSHCSSLTNSTNLPASEVRGYCYQYMYYNCSSLIQVKPINVSTLAHYCCKYMFSNCTSLTISDSSGTKIFTCPSVTSLRQPVTNMFYGVKSTSSETPSAGSTYYYQ